MSRPPNAATAIRAEAGFLEGRTRRAATGKSGFPTVERTGERRAARHFTSKRMARRAAGLLVVVLLLGGGVTVYERLGSRSTPVDVDEVIARFRSSASEPTVAPGAPAGAATIAPGAPAEAAADGVPGPAQAAAAATPVAIGSGPTAAPVVAPAGVEPGVYLYATSGFDDINNLPGKPRHDYPETTTITVTKRGGCDDSRWDILEERWDEWSTCPSGGAVLLERITGYSKFFGVSGKYTYECTAGSVLIPADRSPGAPITRRCDAGDAAMSVAGRVVGIESVHVGGVGVAALHVHVDVEFTGVTEGTQTLDEWYAVGNNLLLKRIRAHDVENSSAMGQPMHSREQVEAVLTSLTPRR